MILIHTYPGNNRVYRVLTFRFFKFSVATKIIQNKVLLGIPRSQNEPVILTFGFCSLFSYDVFVQLFDRVLPKNLYCRYYPKTLKNRLHYPKTRASRALVKICESTNFCAQVKYVKFLRFKYLFIRYVPVKQRVLNLLKKFF